METTSAQLEIYSALIIGIILVTYLINAKYIKKLNISLVALMILQICNLLVDSITYQKMDYDNVIYVAAVELSYIFTGFLLIFFNMYFIDFISDRIKISKWMKTGPIIIITLMCILWILSLKNNLFYKITDKGFIYGKWHILSQLPFAFIMCFDMIYALVYRKFFQKRELFAWELYGIIPFIGFLIGQCFGYEVFIYIGITLSIIIIYLNISIEKDKELIQREKELTLAHTKLMISQIQPHFLFNSLSTIKMLCSQPEVAEEAISDFSDYLRMNLDTIHSDKLISFRDELKHTNIYLKLEKKRFEEYLGIEYDIQYENFSIPALTLQPIVENAVKHGLGNKEEGGNVKISSRKTDKFYEIIVEDDGIGYDIESGFSSDREHIGINNVKHRLEIMCGGKIDIKSVIGKGTIVTISMPINEKI